MANWQGIGKTTNRSPVKYSPGRAFRNEVRNSAVGAASMVNKGVKKFTSNMANKSMRIIRPVGYVGPRPISVVPKVPLNLRIAKIGDRLTATINNASIKANKLVEGSLIRIGNVIGKVVGVTIKKMGDLSYSVVKFIVKFIYSVGKAFAEVTTPKVKTKVWSRDVKARVKGPDGKYHSVVVKSKGSVKQRPLANKIREFKVNAKASTFTAGVLTTATGAVLQSAGVPVKEAVDDAVGKLKEVLGI